MKRFLLPAAALALLGPALLLAAPGQPSPAPPATPPPAPSSTLRRIALPPETGTYRPGPGADLANALCLNCHSVEYCQSQPPLPEKYWDATVKKMKEKFGATLPEETLAPLTKYLVEAYGKKP